MKFKVIKQHDENDCGAACFSMICDHMGLKLPLAKCRELIKVDSNGSNIFGFVDGAKKIGLEGIGLNGNSDELKVALDKGEVKVPFIARIVINSTYEHYVVVYKVTKNKFYIADPTNGKLSFSFKDFFSLWEGQIVIFNKTDNFIPGNEKKGSLFKFIKLVTVQKKLLVSIFLFSILITSISIAGAFVFEYVTEVATSRMTANNISQISENGDDLLDENLGEEYDNYILNQVETISKQISQLLRNGGSIFFRSLGSICIAIIMLYVLQTVMQIFRGYLIAKLEKKIDIPLMLGYCDHIIQLPAKCFTSRKIGEIISRYSDASNIREIISSATLSLMLDTSMAILCGIVLFSISPILLLITISMVLLYILVTMIFFKPIENINQEIMESNSSVMSYFKETIEGIEVIKTYSAETLVRDNTYNKFMKYVDNVFKGSIIYSIQHAFIGMIASIGIIFIIWTGTNLVLTNHITFGQLLTFYVLLGYFITPIGNLIGLQPKIQTAVIAAERLNDFLDLKAETSNSDSKEISLKKDICFNNVYFRYGNRKSVLKNINLIVEKGDKVALIGESGSGKTTLVKLLMSFYEAEKGEITIGGVNIQDISSDHIRQKISFVSQDTFLFADTIINNVRFGNINATDNEVYSACKYSRANDFIEKMPLKYETVLSENGRNLSGGERQRLALARAIIKKPDILILDEATSNLDTITENCVKDIIEKIDDDTTCFVIAHRLSTIKNCNKIAVMQNGEILEFGSHEELIKSGSLYKLFHDLQS